MASGRPSRRRQIWATMATSAASASKPGAAADARTMKSSTASDSPACARSSVDVEGRRAQRPLASHPENLAARGQDAHTGTARQVTLGERRDRPHDRLAIVEHQQQLTVSQPALERVGHRLIRSFRHTELGGHQRDNLFTVSRDGETHEPHPVPVPRQRGGGRLQRESRLAATARSSQGHEPAVPERVEHIGELGSTPNERIDRRGQVVRSRERAQRRELAPERRMRELPDTDLADILQLMTAEIDRRDIGREPVRHLADEHLTTVADRHQPGRPIQLGAVIVAITHTRFAGMHTHPHLHHHALHRRLPRQHLLRRQRRLQRVTSSTERGVEPVTRGLHHIPGVRLDRPAHDLVVSSQHVVHHLGMVQPQTRRTLHIGEQERDRPRRQLRHAEPFRWPAARTRAGCCPDLETRSPTRSPSPRSACTRFLAPRAHVPTPRAPRFSTPNAKWSKPVRNSSKPSPSRP